jgi:sodium-dependent dicarboxylate transporter 2/3/5
VSIGILIFWMVTQVNFPRLEPSGQLAIGVFAACIFLWATEALPLMITSLLALVSFPALGILETKETYALFGSDITFFILGVFILASPVLRSGLSTRIALKVLNRFGRTPEKLITAILLLTAGMSCVMSCHAVAAMFFPVVHTIRKALSLKRQSRFGKALYLSLAWGSVIGGTTTLLGSGRAPLAIAILQENTAQSISFTDWALLALPTMVAMLFVGRLILRLLFRSEIEDIGVARDQLSQQTRALGKVSYREFATALLLCATIGFWITFSTEHLATISLLAVVAAFILGCARWTEVEEDVNWGIVLMYGGAIALGLGMLKTGASAWLAEELLALTPNSSPIVLLAAISFVALWLTEAISNAAVVALFMPPVISIAQQTGIDPRIMALFVAIPCGYAFILPMGTPATALAFSSSFLQQRDTLLAGTLLKLAAWALFIIFALTIWPLMGYEV